MLAETKALNQNLRQVNEDTSEALVKYKELNKKLESEIKEVNSYNRQVSTKLDNLHIRKQKERVIESCSAVHDEIRAGVESG
jgi:hypothetical protein